MVAAPHSPRSPAAGRQRISLADIDRPVYVPCVKSGRERGSVIGDSDGFSDRFFDGFSEGVGMGWYPSGMRSWPVRDGELVASPPGMGTSLCQGE